MALNPVGLLRRLRRRGTPPPDEPKRHSFSFPNLFTLGQGSPQQSQIVYRPSPRNLRYFSHTPMARRAINAIRNPLSQIEWEIAPNKGVKKNSEIERQIEIATRCLSLPNDDDSFNTMMMVLVEDICCGAGALEIARSADPDRPVWLYPVDGLSLNIYAGWSGGRDEARYLQTVGYGSYQMGTSQGVRLRDDEILYVKPNPNTASPFGSGPLEIAFNTIASQLSTASFASKLAGNALPPFMLDLGEVASRVIQQWRSYWTNEVEGEGKIPIIGTELVDDQLGAARTRGVNVLKLYPEGDKALYLAYQEFLRTEIAAAFDLSNMSLNIERDVNRSTAETQEQREWIQAVRPMARLIGGQITRKIIWDTMGFTQIHFAYKGVDREDQEKTANVLKTYWSVNAITSNQIREKIGEPPLTQPWGDMLKVDVDIATAAARGVGVIDDPDLPSNKMRPPAKPAPAAGGSRVRAVAASEEEEDSD